MTVPSAAAWFNWCVVDACTGLREFHVLACCGAAGMLWAWHLRACCGAFVRQDKL